jgi:drug/metabolite transporter superfamily protein YnfA
MQLVTTWVYITHGHLDIFVVNLIAQGNRIDSCVPLEYDLNGKITCAMIVYSFKN